MLLPLPLSELGAAFVMDGFGKIRFDLVKGIGQPALLPFFCQKRDVHDLIHHCLSAYRHCACDKCVTSCHCWAPHPSLSGSLFCQRGSQDFSGDHDFPSSTQETSLWLQNSWFLLEHPPPPAFCTCISYLATLPPPTVGFST